MKSPIKLLTELVTKNMLLKTISLIIAFFIWVMVVSEKKSEIGFVVSLQYQNIPANMEIVGTPVKSLETTVRGHRREINKLSAREIKASIDLSRDKDGKNIHFMTNENIKVGKGIEIVQINPYKVEIILEKSVTKKVPIMPLVTGKPKEGFRIKQITVMPKFTSIVGPESKITAIEHVRTAKLDFTGIDKEFSRRLSIVLKEGNVRLVDKTPPKITVSISEIFDHKIFKNNTVVNETKLRLSLNPAKINVILRGPQKKLNSLKAKDIKIFLTPKQISKNGKKEFFVVPKYKLPERIVLEEMIPEKIKCKILNEISKKKL